MPSRSKLLKTSGEQGYAMGLRHPQLPTGGFGLFGPEVSRGVSERVSPKSGCLRECPGECLGGPRVSKRCPESVSKVSGHLFDTLETLSGHLFDTLGPGAGMRPETLPRTLPQTPQFSGTLSRTFPGTLQARRARSPL